VTAAIFLISTGPVSVALFLIFLCQAESIPRKPYLPTGICQMAGDADILWLL
jgi:hypothetical protein